MEPVKQITRCRACKALVEPLFSLGDQYVIEYPATPNTGNLKAPLELVKCQACHLVQLKHTVDPSRLFTEFWYRSSLSPSMKRELDNIAHQATVEAGLRPKDAVLDIGSNDGTLLDSYSPGLDRWGFEPSNQADSYKGYAKIVKDYFTSGKWREHCDNQPKAITTIAMFYDVEDPNKFTRDIAEVLHPQGVWIDQQNYLGSMLENNGFDNIVHEHLTYWSLTAFSKVLKENDLEVYSVETNYANGGSFRSLICHKGMRKVDSSVKQLIQWEAQHEFHRGEPYWQFFNRIKRLRQVTLKLLAVQRTLGKRVYIMGAGTRGSTIVQFYGLDSPMIEAAVDNNPKKLNRYLVGTGIRVLPRNEVKPDCFLILPHHFLDEFKLQERHWLDNGGEFIVPLPELRVM